jgi:putative transcriptional regulator
VVNSRAEIAEANVIEAQIDKLLKERDKTFYWLAKETGISHTTLWRLKKGRALGINFETLERICRILQCPPGDVLKLSDEAGAIKTESAAPEQEIVASRNG